jgi:hypothetical protein
VGQIQLDNGDKRHGRGGGRGRLRYVADASAGVRVIDISTPSNPFKVGTFLTTVSTQALPSPATSCTPGIPARGSSQWTSPIPATPPKSAASDPGEVVGVTLFGTQLFTGQGSEGIQVLEVSDPAILSRPTNWRLPDLPGRPCWLESASTWRMGRAAADFRANSTTSGSELSQATVETDPVEGNAQSENAGAIHSLQPVEVEEENFDLPPAGGDYTAGHQLRGQ